MGQASVIVVGNEKGGAGKSTLAIHIVTALLHGGAKVAVLDLDLRQQTMGHFFANRAAWLAANGATAPMPIEHAISSAGDALAKAPDTEQLARFEAAFNDVAGQSDFVLIDTPGADTAIMRAAHVRADLIVTRATVERKQIDWVVLRNRLAPTEARNRRRLDERVQALSRKVGFRVGPGLRDRVIYRELFPFGLTVADLSPTIRPVAMSLQHVAARQELRSLMIALGFNGLDENERIAAE